MLPNTPEMVEEVSSHPEEDTFCRAQGDFNEDGSVNIDEFVKSRIHQVLGIKF